MHIEIGVWDALVVGLLCFGFCLKSWYELPHLPPSYQENGPWNPFDEKEQEQAVKLDEHEPPRRTSTPETPSPDDTPVSSQEYRPTFLSASADGTPSPEPPAFSSQTASPVSTRSNSPLSARDSPALVEPESTFVSRVLTNDLLYDLVLLSASPATLVRLARTCRAAHTAVHSHIARSFNIDTHLSRFFTDPLAFRALQARTGTLISGSNALQFLLRTHWPEADLDIYCPYEARADVGWWLVEDGYRFVPNSRQDPSFHVAIDQARQPGTEATDNPYSRLKGVSAVYTFAKRVHDPEGPSRKLKVQIIVAYYSPMDAIFNFHSTVVMNVISYSHAYSLYPRATFHDRVALSTVPARRLDEHVLLKYMARGWRFIHAVPAPPPEVRDAASGQLVRAYLRASECAHCAHCARVRAEERSIARAFPAGPRWIGDGHSWVVPLNTDGVVRAPPQPQPAGGAPVLSRDPSFATTWELVDRAARHGAGGKKIKSTPLSADGFWHTYMIGDAKLKKAMAMVQELYVHIPAGDGTPQEDQYCDEEFIRYCRMMLEDQGMWDRWYPTS